MTTARINYAIVLFLILLAACGGPTPAPTTAPVAPSAQPTVAPPPTTVAVAPTQTSSVPSPVPSPTAPVSPTAVPVTSMFPTGITDEPLQVVSTSPADKAEEVAPTKEQTRIIVQFNHPVVPLVSVEAQATLPQPLTFNPALQGKGEWINTSTYAFTSSQNLTVATKYIVDVAALKDMLGAELSGYSWSFTTASPEIIKFSPESNTLFAGVTEPVSVTFNTEMDRASVEQHFSLKGAQDNAAVTGKYNWQGTILTFVPDKSLAYDTSYIALLTAGAQDISKVAATAKDYKWTFRTVRAPQVLATNPKNGDIPSKSIRDGFQIDFASPMAQDAVTVSIVPTITNQSAYWDKPTHVSISGGWLASETYSVTISGESQTREGEKLGKDTVVVFTAAPLDPAVTLQVNGIMGMYDASQPQVIYASFRNVNRVDYSLYLLPRSSLLRLSGSDRYDYWDKYRPDKNDLQRQWSQSVSAPLNASGLISTTLGGNTPSTYLKPGAYYLEATAPNISAKDSQPSRHVLIVTNYNLALKRTETEALVWATDLTHGKPVANLPITVYGPDGTPLASGKADSDGVFRANFNRVNSYDALLATSEENTDLNAVVGSDWNEGILTYDFTLPTQYQAQEYYANLYTDRPIYRPGQTVYFKGILRRDNDGRYTLRDELKTVPIKINDDQGKQVFSDTLSLSQYGTFNGAFNLSSAASLGFYYVNLELGEDPNKFYSSVGFQVAQYRAPQFQVDVTTDKKEYFNGETIKADVDSTYFFGGPVSDAKVQWRLLSDDLFFTTDKVKGFWDFTDTDLTQNNHPTGGVVREGKGVTDKQGKFSFTVPADLKDFPLSQNFTLDVEVTDINNEAVSNRAVVPVHKGDFYIGMRPQSYVGSVNQKQSFDIITVTPQGDPSPNQNVTVSFFEHKWFSVRQKGDDGQFVWTSSYSDTLVSKTEVKTDALGVATASFTPTVAGVYKVVGDAKDSVGNAIHSATYQWISGNEFVNWRIENNDRIDLVADKKIYNVGDTAQVLIPAPFENSEALLTIERGTIREVKRLTLPGNSETISIPITADYAPNVFVSVMLVKGRGADSPTPQFKLGYANLNVAVDEKLLTVKVSTDHPTAGSTPAQYTPGDKPQFTIQATDYQGKPVSAEFSVALVDKAIQSLADDNATSLQQAFYGPRGIGVQTSASWVRSVERINLTVQPEAKGGGGGPGLETSPVRRNFQDTAFWKADVVTDASGKAEVDIPLPDNLTTWNFTAKGVTKDTLVGTGKADIVSTKDLLVRPVVPRFFVPGDQVLLEAVVNNNTANDINADVRLDAQGLTLSSNAVQPLTIKANDKAKVTWNTTVNAVESVVVTMSANGGNHNDAIELTLPVVRPTSGETVATAGQVDSKIAEQIQVPADADTTAGGLQINLNPSLAAASRDSLTYLEAFPYDCSEQVVSKFFPNVVTYQALTKLGIEQPELEKELEANISNQVQLLYQLQHQDGGWGWWADDASQPNLTAYALYGLSTASDAGFSVDKDVMDRARKYLDDYLDKPVDAKASYGYDERAFVIFVLNEITGEYGGRALNLYDKRANLANYGKAFLLMALEKENPKQAQTLEDELTGAAITSATGVHWEEKQRDAYMMNTDTRSTAIIIDALSRVNPKNTTLANAVRWLMSVRKADHWETTQETAWSVLGLTEFMLATVELNANYNYEAILNSQSLGSGSVDKSNVEQSKAFEVAMKDLVTNAANQLVITRTPGPGNLYYSAFLNYFLPADKIQALDRGIIVGRQYFAVDQATLKPTDKVISSANVGDYVQVRLTIIASTDLNYLQLQDPLPAGFEAVDTTLKTSSSAASGPELKLEQPECSDCASYYRPYWSYWAHSEVRDDRVAAFATFLGRGTYEYTYMMRASVSGNFRALPTTASEMYFPDVFGRSQGAAFTVTGE